MNELDEVQDVSRTPRHPETPQPENSDQGNYEVCTHHSYASTYHSNLHKPQRSLTRIIFSLLYLPIGLVSGILRFVSGILRIPRLASPFNFSTNYRILRQTYPDSRSATRRWITSLEEETGAVNFKTETVAATGLGGRQSTSRRHAYPPASPADESKILPDFFDGTYEEVLDTCQKEGRIACVILVSAEHDDVAEFKRLVISPADEPKPYPPIGQPSPTRISSACSARTTLSCGGEISGTKTLGMVSNLLSSLLIALTCIAHSCSEITGDNIPICSIYSATTPPEPLVQLVFFHLNPCADCSLASPWALGPRVWTNLASETDAPY